MATTEQKAWPYGENLVEIRGQLNVSQAAKKLDVDRQTWTAWEQGRQRPKLEMLKAIVETFDCPPELVGYEAPRGWELVPAGWLQAEAEKQRLRHEEQQEALRGIDATLAALMRRTRNLNSAGHGGDAPDAPGDEGE